MFRFYISKNGQHFSGLMFLSKYKFKFFNVKIVKLVGQDVYLYRPLALTFPLIFGVGFWDCILPIQKKRRNLIIKYFVISYIRNANIQCKKKFHSQSTISVVNKKIAVANEDIDAHPGKQCCGNKMLSLLFCRAAMCEQYLKLVSSPLCASFWLSAVYFYCHFILFPVKCY